MCLRPFCPSFSAAWPLLFSTGFLEGVAGICWLHYFPSFPGIFLPLQSETLPPLLLWNCSGHCGCIQWTRCTFSLLAQPFRREWLCWLASFPLELFLIFLCGPTFSVCCKCQFLDSVTIYVLTASSLFLVPLSQSFARNVKPHTWWHLCLDLLNLSIHHCPVSH